MRRRIQALAALAAVIALAAPSAAETISVRSGEHDGFSRLVLTMAEPATGWTFGRLDDGYQLRLGRKGVHFDLAEVFARIPRSRLADISAEDAAGRLSLRLACACHAEVFAFRPNVLVIDIRPGAAKANSPFEKPLEVAAAPDPRPRSRPDAVEGYDWRKVDLPALAPAVPSALALPKAPDPAIEAARVQLLHQLARAGAQGLIKADARRLGLPDGAAAGQAPSPDPEAPAAAQPSTPEAQAGTGQIGLHAETVMDRDAPEAPRPGLSSDGTRCPSDATVDIAHWGDARRPGAQIGTQRRDLLGEFDRPRPEAIVALTRLYLYLGFGAEARNVLKAFAVTGDDGTRLTAMAAIIDDETPEETRPLAGLGACDGAVALWSVLATPAPAPGDPVDTGAVLRTFSALPVHLRRLLGPRLSQVFLARHDTETARSLRDAIVRAPGDPGAAVHLLDARLDIATGKLGAAEATIDKVVAEGGPMSPEAMVMLIDTRVERREPVDPATAEAVAALAHEYRNTPLGPRLARAHLLALGLSEDFTGAFAELAALHRTEAGADTGAPALWAILAARGTDEAVAQNALVPPEGPIAPATRLAMADRLIALGFDAAANAWLSAGLPDDDARRLRRGRAALGAHDGRAALRVLAGLTDPAAALLRARAYAMLGEHDRAAAVYGGIGAARLQGAEAWRAGDWGLAREYGTEAQKAALAAAFGDAPATGGPADAATGTEAAAPEGQLAQGRALVEDSRKARAVLAALLAETPAAGAVPGE